jgi:hypothetical protein
MFYLLWYNIENKWKENMLVEHQIIFFFCLSIIVSIFTKKLIVDKLDAISSFDSYVFSKLQMSEWWELQNEDNCEFQLRFSPKDENCFLSLLMIISPKRDTTTLSLVEKQKTL